MSTYFILFFFNATATAEIYTFPYTTLFRSEVELRAAGVCHSDLHLALGHLGRRRFPTVLGHEGAGVVTKVGVGVESVVAGEDRKSTRLNSSHSQISYAVFCLKKKKNN